MIKLLQKAFELGHWYSGLCLALLSRLVVKDYTVYGYYMSQIEAMNVLEQETFMFIKRALLFAEAAAQFCSKGPWEHYENVLLFLFDVVTNEDSYDTDSPYTEQFYYLLDYFIQNSEGYSLLHQNKTRERQLMATMLLASLKKDLPQEVLDFH